MSNTAIWDVLGKTDPDQTKQFQRGGGFKGTAIKPIYTERKMTEEFGPCGIGWGINEPVFQVVPAGEETLVYCTVSIWYVQNDVRSAPVYGVGGDMAVKKFSAKTATDDEAFKKAFTDAVGNAMKHLGMSADVHMGRFDDSKYVAAVREEIADKAKGPEDRTPAQVCQDFLDLVAGITDRDEYVDAWNAEKSVLKKIQRTAPEIYNAFIADLSKIIAPKGFNETKEDSGAVPGNNPPPAADPKGTDKGSDGVIKEQARKIWEALSASKNRTMYEATMKLHGYLTMGEDGPVVKAYSNFAAIRDAEPEVFNQLMLHAMKVKTNTEKAE